jgi:two-component system cell cycle sensor histidine kinase/response regulator CckA
VSDSPAAVPRKTILVVDDEPLMRDVLRRWLEAAGYAVVEAGSAPEAIGFLEGKRLTVDLMITDLRMPGIDGDQLIGWATRAHPELPVICLTGYAEEAQAGVTILEKPVQGDRIVKAVKAGLRQAQATPVPRRAIAGARNS